MIVYYAKKREMLCEEVYNIKSENKRLYSLALSQMAFWFFLVITASIALFVITKEIPNLTESILILIGISTGTALGSRLINNQKNSEEAKKRQPLLDEKIN